MNCINIPSTICDNSVDTIMLVLWDIFCYSNNNCTFLTYIEWGGGGGRDGDAIVDMLQVSQCFFVQYCDCISRVLRELFTQMWLSHDLTFSEVIPT